MPDLSSLFNKYAIVRQITVFSKLNWLELHQVASKSTIIACKKGEVICREGTPPDALYCLVSGRLLAYATTPAGEREDIDFIHRGMHFGIISLLTGEKHSLTFEALNDSVILKISKKDFDAILKVIPRLGVVFSQSLSRRIRSHQSGGKSIFESTIISIYSPAKGTGSSTYAFNLALSLQKETKRKGILLNISPYTQKSTVVSSDTKEAAPQWKKQAVDLNDIIGDHEKIIGSVSHKELPIGSLNVVFDPADRSIVDQIGQFVSTLAHDYHYVIVDLPNSMDDVVLQTLVQSDLVHLITLDTEEQMRMTKQVIGRLKGKLKDSFSANRVQVLISGVGGKCYLSYEQLNKSLEYNITTVIPHIQRSELNVAVVSEDVTLITPSPQSEYSQMITRMARRIGGVMVGLVLGGGAALGVAHIGVIRVLERNNIPVDVVVGSSMGALIGSLWVTGRNSDELEKVAREFTNKKSMLKLLDPVFPKAGLIGGRAIRLWLKGHLGTKTFFSTKIPLKVVAYDLTRREELIIEEGLLIDGVRKSIAIPGVINPILDKERVIIDGGVLNPLPTNVLSAMGLKKIIAVNVLQSPEHVTRGYALMQEKLQKEEAIPFLKSPSRYMGVRFRKLMGKIFLPNISDIIVCTLQATEYVIAQQSSTQADIVIHPDLTGINWFELYQVDRLIKCGEEAAEKHLEAIKHLVG